MDRNQSLSHSSVAFRELSQYPHVASVHIYINRTFPVMIHYKRNSQPLIIAIHEPLGGLQKDIKRIFALDFPPDLRLVSPHNSSQSSTRRPFNYTPLDDEQTMIAYLRLIQARGCVDWIEIHKHSRLSAGKQKESAIERETEPPKTLDLDAPPEYAPKDSAKDHSNNKGRDGGTRCATQ